MREVLDGLRAWRAEGRRFALATVIRTWSSSPRPAGAVMAVDETGEVLGSVSGGCVEGAVHDAALRVLGTGVPEVCRFGVSTEDAFAVGLTCGGELEVYVEPVELAAAASLDRVLDALHRGEPVVLATVLGADRATHLVLDATGACDGDADPRVAEMVSLPTTGTDHAELVARERDGLVLVQSFAPPPRMIVFGAIDFADAVARMGRFLGYRVTVCDARAVFATPARFPEADEVVVDWPHRYLAQQDVDPSTVLCVLTHDPKFDVPLLEVALRTEAGFIGVLGSRRTQADRVVRLRERGVSDVALARLRGPVGLDLGARTPAETAVSIAAEIVAAREGRTGAPLRDLDAPIHDAQTAGLVCGV
jgi:xanthine dehydrogenase accessory factor